MFGDRSIILGDSALFDAGGGDLGAVGKCNSQIVAIADVGASQRRGAWPRRSVPLRWR